jgi:integrase
MPKDTGKPKRTRHNAPRLGTVYEVRPGYHRGEVTYTDPGTGERTRIRVHGRTAAEARDKLDDERRKRRIGSRPNDPTLTLAEYLADWTADRRDTIRPSTWRTSEMYVRVYLIPALGRLTVAGLTAVDVQRAMRSFAEKGRPPRADDKRTPRPVAAVTVNHIRATLRAALTDAQKAGIVARNVAADAAPHAVKHRPVTYFTTHELNRLLEATADSEFGPLYALAATTGLRRGELLGLRWSDVSDGGVLTVRQAMARDRDGGWSAGDVKSARSRRSIPLPARARQALETQRSRQRFAERAAAADWHNPDGLVFTDALGAAILPEYVSHRWPRDRDSVHSCNEACAAREHADAAGRLPKRTFHDLRHSAATALLSAGVPLVVIRDWLGHADINVTTKAYAAVVPELMTDAADAMDRALAGGAS